MKQDVRRPVRVRCVRVLEEVPWVDVGAQGLTAFGSDGLLVEVPPAPEKAVSDGAQSLDLTQFLKMMQDLRPYLDLWKTCRVTEAAATV